MTQIADGPLPCCNYPPIGWEYRWLDLEPRGGLRRWAVRRRFPVFDPREDQRPRAIGRALDQAVADIADLRSVTLMPPKWLPWIWR